MSSAFSALPLRLSAVLVALGLAGPGVGVAEPVLPNTGEVNQVLGWRADLLARTWSPDKSIKVQADGGRGAFGNLGCLFGAEPRTEIEVEGGAQASHRIVSFRGPTEKCVPTGVGVIRFADGSQWVGRIGTVGSLAVPEGLGELTHADGLRNILEARRVGSDWSVARGFLVYHAEQDWYAQAEFDANWNAREGVYRWNDGREFRGRLVDGAPQGRGRYLAPGGIMVEGEVVQAADGLQWRGVLSVTMPSATGFGPPGTYLLETAPDLPLGAPIVPMRWAPSPELLRMGVSNDRGCPIPPEMPTAWVAWWPACGSDPASGEILIPVYSPDLTFLLTYVVRDGELSRSVLDQLGDTRQSLAPVQRWEALMFRSTRQGFQSLGDIRMFDAAGNFMYQGAFQGLDPQGEGYCGKPAAEGGGVEPCTWSAGQRVDAAHRQRQARLAQEVQQKRFEEQLAAQRQAQAQAAEQAARVAREQAAAADAPQKRGGFFGRIGGNLLGVVTGRKSVGDAARDAAVQTTVQAAVQGVLPPSLPPAAPAGNYSSLAAAVAAQQGAPGGGLASIQQRRLDHVCPSGFRLSIDVPYRTEGCLATKLEYTKAQVCGDNARLVSLEQACRNACGSPNCAE